MFERYTEAARRALFFARYEASRLGGISIEAEHLLLGLLREPKGVTGRVFAQTHVPLEEIRKEIERMTTFREKIATSIEVPFSDQTRRILQHAAAEADRLLHTDINTEHLLLGILCEERCGAASVLAKKGMRLDAIRLDVVQARNQLASYGQPALQIGPLRIWVHGRQFPDAMDAWDGNWLNVTAHYVAHGASVVVAGPVLDTVSFASFGKELKTLHQWLSGEAKLESVEPDVMVRIVGGGETGRMQLRVEMTPDNVAQGHWFEQEIDQSYLPAAIAACEAVVERYPVRNGAERGA